MSPHESSADQLPWQDADQAEWLALMCGDADAVQFIDDIAYWSHVYDDLIDQDKPVTPDAIHKMMWKVMVGLPMNPFYRKHEQMLRPLIINGIFNWHAANQMEASGELEELRVAHVVRHSLGDIALMAMALTGGQDHAIKNARRCRLLMQTGSWAQYRQEHFNADPK